ncbi:MAG: single-stranded-DNA-specific exonuclease RecJ [Armatimonadota bacterium]|nr:single-stranded-DNA-specific exonuclease RecJ [Armatimonadota bacterium]
MARYRWQLRAADEAAAQRLAKELSLTLPTARLLVARGYTEPDAAYRFLNPSLHDLADPSLLPDVEPAVRRLALAVERKEPVLVYGDYDADGITATALWLTTLRKLGVPAQPYLPHREREGYDLHLNAIAAAQAIGARLILTCDCGIRAHEVVDAINAAGLEVVITDHHEPDIHLPNAVAVVNPKRADSRYPFRELSGVGVSFRVAEALLRALNLPRNGFYRTMLELVAIGTVADVMPIVGENRILVKHGLERLHQTKRVGLQSLMQVARLGKRKPTPRDIGFALAPRLNAAGRLEDAQIALQLLLEEDATEAQRLAVQLDARNRERQRHQEVALREAIAQVELEHQHRQRALVVHSEKWHHGIVGLVAGKLKEAYYRPAVVAVVEHETGLVRGSMRSTPELNLTELIERMKPFCVKCGGHASAGGFAAPLEHWDALRTLIVEFANARLTDDDLVPTLTVDQTIEAHAVNIRLVHELSLLEPFGTGNEPPLFLARAVEVLGSRTSQDGKHLFLKVRGEGGIVHDAVLWNGGDYLLEAGTRADFVFEPEEDTYNGYGAVRWVIRDFEERV